MAVFKPGPDKPVYHNPKSTQKSVPLLDVFTNGIFGHEFDMFDIFGWFGQTGKYTASFVFTDINYSVASENDQETMFYGYEDILNALDHNHLAQITIMNKHYDDKQLKKAINVSEKGDAYDEYRDELNKVNFDRATQGFNSIVQQKIITVSCRKRFEEAKTYFNRVEGNLKNYFGRIGSDCRRLSTLERLKLFHDFYRPGEEAFFNVDLEDIKKRGHYVNNYICPWGMKFEDDYFKIGNKFGRVLFLSDYPSALEDSFIAEMTDLPKPLVLSIDLISKSPDEANRIISRIITNIEADIAKHTKKSNEAGNWNASIPPHLERKLAHAKKLQHDIQERDQRLILANVTVLHMADSLQELNIDTDNLLSMARSRMVQFGVCLYQQEAGLNTCLPFGVRQTGFLRTLTTEAAAVMIPFTTQEVWDEGGFCYGINEISKNLVIANRRLLMNGNGFILGVPGSGKSFMAKAEIANIFLSTDDDILIVDPENEFSELAKIFGASASVFDIKAGSKHHLNAMELNRYYDGEDDPIALKSDMVVSLIEMTTKGRFIEGTDSILDRCILRLLDGLKPGENKTLNDLYDMLLEQKEPLAQDIALRLEIFTKGSLNTFAHPTNVNLDNRLVVFNIRQLGPTMKAMGMMIILDNIMNRVTYNMSRGKRTWVYMDELHVLYKYELTSNAVDDMWRRFRKYGAFATGMTQNVEALLKSDNAKTMISNSEFIIMLNQSDPDKKTLAGMLNISEAQLGYITNSVKGHGLMRRSGVIVPFDATFPQDTKLYKVMTTKFEDRQAAIAQR